MTSERGLGGDNTLLWLVRACEGLLDAIAVALYATDCSGLAYHLSYPPLLSSRLETDEGVQRLGNDQQRAANERMSCRTRDKGAAGGARRFEERVDVYGGVRLLQPSFILLNLTRNTSQRPPAVLTLLFGAYRGHKRVRVSSAGFLRGFGGSADSLPRSGGRLGLPRSSSSRTLSLGISFRPCWIARCVVSTLCLIAY